MKLQLLIIIVITFSTVFALKITENTITNGPYSFPTGTISIEDSIFWSIWNNHLNILKGDMNIDGSFYITFNERGISFSLKSYEYNFQNSGTVAFNSAKYSSYMFRTKLLNNTGNTFFIASGGGSMKKVSL